MDLKEGSQIKAMVRATSVKIVTDEHLRSIFESLRNQE
jgi:hypothetical protein